MTPEDPQALFTAKHALTAAVTEALHYRNFDCATFLAKRLAELHPDDEQVAFLLGDALFQAGRFRACHHHLLTSPFVVDSSPPHSGSSLHPTMTADTGQEMLGDADGTPPLAGDRFRCSFLLARSSVELKLYAQAEAVLKLLLPHADGGRQHVVTLKDADRAACLHLLGTICVRSRRTDQAARYFSAALNLNPLMVSAALSLAELGISTLDPDSWLDHDRVLAWLKHAGTGGGFGHLHSFASVAKANGDEEQQQQQQNIENAQRQKSDGRRHAATEHIVKPSRIPRTLSTRRLGDMAASKLSGGAARDKKRTRSGDTILAPVCAEPQHAKLQAQPQCDLKPANAWSDLGKVLDAMRCMCRASFQLHTFKLDHCLTTLAKLPAPHCDSSWCVSLQAQASFEAGDYHSAARYFRRLRQLQPYSSSAMDIYSTVLWHLKDVVSLQALAQELFAGEGTSNPVAWCSAGNAFSLQKEHENALASFQKAIALDPDYAYAHNLCGHEYHASEAYDKALVCFQNAIRLNPRLYNSWYGLGMVFFKQEKWQLAEHHFRTALSIHITSTVLHSFLGMVYHKTKRHDEALLQFDKGIQLNARNPQVRYRKALCLADMGRDQEALREFNATILLAPTESHVHFKAAMVYGALGQTSDALRHLTCALDLDPKSAGHVRDAMAKLSAVSESDFSFA